MPNMQYMHLCIFLHILAYSCIFVLHICAYQVHIRCISGAYQVHISCIFRAYFMHICAYLLHIKCIFHAYFCIQGAYQVHILAYVLHMCANLMHICCIFLHICCICLHIICIFLAYSCISNAYLCIFLAYSLHMIAYSSLFLHIHCICPPGGPLAVSSHALRPCPAWHANGFASNTSDLVRVPNPNHPTQTIIPSVQHFDRVPPLHSGADSLSSSSLPTPLSQPGFPPRSQLLPGPLCLVTVLGLHLCNSFLPLILRLAGFLAHCMSLLHAGERKVPEIMVHKLQEALAKQLDMFGSNAVLLESGTDSVSKFCLKTTKYAKTN